MDAGFNHPSFLIRRKVLKLLGGAFHIFDPHGQLVFYSKMKAFKLKEDIRLYTGEDMRQEVLTITTKQILDFSAAYDVVDTATGERVGALKRKGLKSILRDEWIIMDAQDRDIGLVREDSTALALLRRFLTNLIPQKFEVQIGSRPVATFKQNFNPFVMKIQADFSQDVSNMLDKRLGLAAAILMCAIEGRQG